MKNYINVILVFMVLVAFSSCIKEKVEPKTNYYTTNTVHKKVAHLKMAGGQSNIVGQGFIYELPSYLLGKLKGCYVYNPNTDTIEILQVGVNNEGQQVGIELSYMLTIDSLTNYTNGDINVLVKYGVDGTALHKDSTKLDWNVESKNELYFNLVQKILRAKEVLELAGYEVVIDDLVWYQGESDTDFGGWYDNAKAMFTQLKKDINTNNLKICIVRIHPKFDIYKDLFEAVRHDQELLSKEHGFCMLDIDKYDIERVHLHTSSYVSVGIDAAILLSKY